MAVKCRNCLNNLPRRNVAPFCSRESCNSLRIAYHRRAAWARELAANPRPECVVCGHIMRLGTRSRCCTRTPECAAARKRWQLSTYPHLRDRQYERCRQRRACYVEHGLTVHGRRRRRAVRAHAIEGIL